MFGSCHIFEECVTNPCVMILSCILLKILEHLRSCACTNLSTGVWIEFSLRKFQRCALLSRRTHENYSAMHLPEARKTEKPLRKWLVVQSQRLAALLQEMDTNKTPSSGRDIFLFSKSHVPLVADLISLRRIYMSTLRSRESLSSVLFPQKMTFFIKLTLLCSVMLKRHTRALCLSHSLTTGCWRKVKSEQSSFYEVG
jgi:hypothetical protein